MVPGSSPVPRVLGGQYEIVSEIGRGAMGIVFRALDRETGRFVALKALHGGDPDDLYRLKNEFRSLSRIAHPNLLRLYEMVVEGGHGFFTMEYIEDGVSLVEHVRRAGERAPVDGAEAAREAALRAAFSQLALALSALHRAGTIHRDLKPSNVLVDPRGRVVLLDFGLAAGIGSELAVLSQVGSFVGTLAYMAPEQALGRPLTQAADWYSFGVLLYECLTGRSPFRGRRTGGSSSTGRASSFQPRSPVHPAAAPTSHASRPGSSRSDPVERPDVGVVLAGVSPAAAPVQATPRSPLGAGPFVGRSSELEQLRQVFRSARCVEPAASRWSRAPRASARRRSSNTSSAELAADGALVLRARCYPDERVSFEALDEVGGRAEPLPLVALRTSSSTALLPAPRVRSAQRLSRAREGAAPRRDAQAALRRRASRGSATRLPLPARAALPRRRPAAGRGVGRRPAMGGRRQRAAPPASCCGRPTLRRSCGSSPTGARIASSSALLHGLEKLLEAALPPTTWRSRSVR